MKITFLPTTKLGRLASILIIAFLIFIAIFFLMVNVFNQRGGDTFFSNLLLTVPFLLAFASAVLASVFSLISIIAKKERSISVFITMIVGLLVSSFGFTELLFTH